MKDLSSLSRPAHYYCTVVYCLPEEIGVVEVHEFLSLLLAPRLSTADSLMVVGWSQNTKNSQKIQAFEANHHNHSQLHEITISPNYQFILMVETCALCDKQSSNVEVSSGCCSLQCCVTGLQIISNVSSMTMMMMMMMMMILLLILIAFACFVF